MNPIRRRGRREGTGLRAAPFSPSLAQRRGRSEVKEGPGRDPLALLWKERPLIPVRGKLKGVQRSHQGQGPEVNHLDNRQAPCPAWSPSPRVSVTCSQPRRRFTCSGSHPESPLLRALPGARSPRSKEPDAPLTLLLPKASSGGLFLLTQSEITPPLTLLLISSGFFPEAQRQHAGL